MAQPQLAKEYRRGEHVLCALSGGADSVALLFLLKRAAEAEEIVLSAAHFEHGIRGQDSLDDMRFVRALCARLAVPLYLEAGDAPGYAGAHGMGLEEAARRLRYDFLRRAARLAGADVIALAHHKDDQAETVLMHLLRGSAKRGMVGMRAREGDLIRPLLDVPKVDLVRFLTELGEPWREDATNRVPDAPRNALRIEALPRLEAIYPGAKAALCRYAKLAAEDEDWLQAEASRWLAGRCASHPFGASLTVDATVAPALLKRALAELLPEVNFGLLERLEALYRADRGAQSLPGARRAERTGGRLYLIDEQAHPPRQPVKLESGAALEGIGRVELQKTDPIPVRTDRFRQVLDAEAVAGAVLRVRRPGDRIRPLGMRGDKLLSDYLIDKKIDRPLRDFLPLVARGDFVLWAVGVGISREAALKPGCEAVEIRFIGV